MTLLTTEKKMRIYWSTVHDRTENMSLWNNKTGYNMKYFSIAGWQFDDACYVIEVVLLHFWMESKATLGGIVEN